MNWEELGAVRRYVIDAIRAGAAEIRARGWVQGRFLHEESGAVDAVQAVGLAVGIDVAHSHTRELRLPAGSCILLGAVLQTLCEELRCRAVSVWNDGEDMTIDSVIEALEAVAGRLEARHE